MNADDPRHGTTRGYRAGCRDACCRAANTRYDQYRRLDLIHGIERTVPAIGARRRVEALQRMAWSLADIAAASGWKSEQAVHRVIRRERVTIATAERVNATYDRLCMTEGPSNGARRRAIKRDYAPPLAWDDIDDPNEQPRDWHYREPERADALADLADRGAGITEACRVLKLSRASLERWCERNDLRDLYVTLVGREHVDMARGNQWTKEGAA